MMTPVSLGSCADPSFSLQADPSSGALGLYKAGDKYPLVIDFNHPLFQKHLHQALYQGDLLLKAVSIKPSYTPLRILDATAGLGYDGFLLAAKALLSGYSEENCVIEWFEHNQTIYYCKML